MTPRERATVLAALRWWNVLQTTRINEPRRGDSYFTEHDPMTPPEVDDLCKRLALHQATGRETDE